MKVIERTLRLTWRKALVVTALYAGLLLAHYAVDAVFHINETVLFLAAVFFVPMWAISAAVYTFDTLMIPTRIGRRRLR